jgi:hypothetical protein
MPHSPQRLPFATPKRPYFIGPQDAIALRELYEELPYAAMRAAAALRADGTILRGMTCWISRVRKMLSRKSSDESTSS